MPTTFRPLLGYPTCTCVLRLWDIPHALALLDCGISHSCFVLLYGISQTPVIHTAFGLSVAIQCGISHMSTALCFVGYSIPNCFHPMLGYPTCTRVLGLWDIPDTVIHYCMGYPTFPLLLNYGISHMSPALQDHGISH
jgi:hypothetical protein